MSLMGKMPMKNILLIIIDLPELVLRNFYALARLIFFPKLKQQKKIKSLSANAGLIESKHKGLRVISIEVMDGFSVYHGVHKKEIKPETLEKIREAVSTNLTNNNVFVSIEGRDHRMLKVVIQNLTS